MNVSADPVDAPKKVWIYPLVVLVVAIVGFPIAAGFYTPSGARARVLLPGVLISVGMGVVGVLAFFRCPRRPRWAKILTLVLSIPSMLFAVHCVMAHAVLSQ